MNLGDIYKWNTTKVIGHASRDKFHVFISPADQVDDHTFLFISTAGYLGDYEINSANSSLTWRSDCGRLTPDLGTLVRRSSKGMRPAFSLTPFLPLDRWGEWRLNQSIMQLLEYSL